MRLFLQQQRSAFLFGNTAPDVQVVSGQPRQATHFHDLPILKGATPAWEVMLEVHPGLANSGALPAKQAAFLAGFLCHLLADWWWVLDIYAPFFGPERRWGSFSQRLYLHNVLRASLDLKLHPGLSNGTASSMVKAEPAGWLPFVQDSYLRRWRDLLAGQLRPGAGPQTVAVFAARQGIAPEQFYALLESEERMQREVFSRMPSGLLGEYRQHLVEESLRLLHGYLGSGPGSGFH